MVEVQTVGLVIFLPLNSIGLGRAQWTVVRWCLDLWVGISGHDGEKGHQPYYFSHWVNKSP